MHKRVVVVLGLVGLFVGLFFGCKVAKGYKRSRLAEVEKEYEGICSDISRLKSSLCINDDVDLLEMLRVDYISWKLGTLNERKKFLENKYKSLGV